MKHTLHVLLVIVFCLSFVLACGPKAAPPAPPPAPTQVVPPPTAPPAAPTKAPEPTKTAPKDELDIPQAWIDGAKKEGKLKFMSTVSPSDMAEILAEFKNKYPYIKDIEYTKASHEVRAVRTLVEFKQGRVVTDVMTGLGGTMSHYKEAKALIDLREFPTYAGFGNNFKDPEGHWMAKNLAYWGIAINTNLVKKADYPKTWEDLAVNPRWKDKALGIGNRPQLFVLMLWKHWGPEKTKKWDLDLFENQSPQLRKEGMNAMITLLSAGEFHMNFPAATYRVKQLADKGAPVIWYTPEPVLTAGGEIAILRGSPNPNAGKIFLNWFTSKEGQAISFKHSFLAPAHPELRTPEFATYPEQQLNRTYSHRMPMDEVLIQPEIEVFWKKLWLEGGGEAR